MARRAADLAAVQTRANPGLTVAATRAREQTGDRYQQTFTVGLRVPLGRGDRAQAKQSRRRAEPWPQRYALLPSATGWPPTSPPPWPREGHAGPARCAGTPRSAGAGHRGFVDKAFRLGEADDPRACVWSWKPPGRTPASPRRIDAAAAISHLRQALGLLPQ